MSTKKKIKLRYPLIQYLMILLYKLYKLYKPSITTLNVLSQFDLTAIKSFYITHISNFQTHIPTKYLYVGNGRFDINDKIKIHSTEYDRYSNILCEFSAQLLIF